MKNATYQIINNLTPDEINIGKKPIQEESELLLIVTEDDDSETKFVLPVPSQDQTEFYRTPTEDDLSKATGTNLTFEADIYLRVENFKGQLTESSTPSSKWGDQLYTIVTEKVNNMLS